MNVSNQYCKIDEESYSGKTRHGLHVADQWIKESSTNRRTNITDRQTETRWHTLLGRIVRERQVGLGHADGQTSKALG